MNIKTTLNAITTNFNRTHQRVSLASNTIKNFFKKIQTGYTKLLASIFNGVLSIFFPKEVEKYIKIICYIAIPFAMFFGFKQFFTAPTFIEAMLGLILTVLPKFIITNIDLR